MGRKQRKGGKGGRFGGEGPQRPELLQVSCEADRAGVVFPIGLKKNKTPKKNIPLTKHNK